MHSRMLCDKVKCAYSILAFVTNIAAVATSKCIYVDLQMSLLEQLTRNYIYQH